jgi:hypothetical protein
MYYLGKNHNHTAMNQGILLVWFIMVFFLCAENQAEAKCIIGEGCYVDGIKFKAETTLLTFDLGSFVQNTTLGEPTQNSAIGLGFKPTFFWGWLEGQMHFDLMSIDPYTVEGPISENDLNEVVPGLFPEYEDISDAIYQFGLERYQTIEIGYALAFEVWKIVPFSWPFITSHNNSTRFLNVGLGFGAGYMEAEGFLAFCESSLCRRKSTNSFMAKGFYSVQVYTANLMEFNGQSSQARLFTITRGQVSHKFVIVDEDVVPFVVNLDTIEFVSFSWFF